MKSNTLMKQYITLMMEDRFKTCLIVAISKNIYDNAWSQQYRDSDRMVV
jgi:hypothetical protein